MATDNNRRQHHQQHGHRGDESLNKFQSFATRLPGSSSCSSSYRYVRYYHVCVPADEM